MGRRKMKIEKIKDRDNLKVTFSKRRGGLCKKASALCTLCAAEVAVITFSPGGNPFVFGHPSVDTVLHRFLSEKDDDNGGGFWWDGAIDGLNFDELKRFKQSLERLMSNVGDKLEEMEKRRNYERNYFGADPSSTSSCANQD